MKITQGNSQGNFKLCNKKYLISIFQLHIFRYKKCPTLLIWACLSWNTWLTDVTWWGRGLIDSTQTRLSVLNVPSLNFHLEFVSHQLTLSNLIFWLDLFLFYFFWFFFDFILRVPKSVEDTLNIKLHRSTFRVQPLFLFVAAVFLYCVHLPHLGVCAILAVWLWSITFIACHPALFERPM